MADPSLMPPQQDQNIGQQRPTPGQAIAAFGAAPMSSNVGPQTNQNFAGAGGGYHTQSTKMNTGYGFSIPIAHGSTGTIGGGQTWGGGDTNTQQSGFPKGYQNSNNGSVYAPGQNVNLDPYGGGGGAGGPNALWAQNGAGGGQSTLQSGAFYTPDAGSESSPTFQDAALADDENAANIYNVIDNQLDNRAYMAAPQLGAAQNFAGTQQANPMMTTGAKLDTGQDLQYAGAQNAQINALAQIASGQGPSVAAVTAQQQRDANIASSMAMLGSQRGASSAGLGLRSAAMGAAQANQAASQQAALGRAQEATAAQAQLTGALSGARGQGQSTATTQANLSQAADLANQQGFNAAAQNQAGLYQQAGLANQAAQNQFSAANQQAELQQTSLNNASYQSGVQDYMGQNEQDIQNRMSEGQQIANEEIQRFGIDENVGVQQAQMGMQAVGSGIGALGALAMLSDRREKTEIRSADGKLGVFLDRWGAMTGAQALAALGRRR